MNIDKQLENLIKNKRVAIIGPAEYVHHELDDNHGEYIDSYDIVIRLNSLFHVPEDLKKYYGTKYNIISSAFWHRLNNDYQDKDLVWKQARFCSEEDYKNLNDKTILLECYARNEFLEIYNKFKKTIDSKNLYYGNISYEKQIEIHHFLRNCYPISKTPTTGLSTIALILLCKPRKLYVTGITCYQENPYKPHFDGYYKQSEETVWNYNTIPTNGYDIKSGSFNDKDGKENDNVHHNFNGEAKILKKLVEEKFLKVDKYLKKLLKKIN